MMVVNAWKYSLQNLTKRISRVNVPPCQKTYRYIMYILQSYKYYLKAAVLQM